MKRTLLKLMLIAFIPFLSCRDEVDVDGLLSFPPAIQESFPFDNGQVVIGGFDVRVLFADGKNSPLRTGSVTLEDAAGNELYSVTEDLSGTLDSINIAGTEFDADLLGAGDYKMIVTAEDSKGQSETYEMDFTIITSLYPANNEEMYIAGEFNSWGALEMELVGAYTWRANNVNFNGGKFKFKNTTDWTDQDWGDADCDKVMAVTTGGGPDTNCGYTGPMNVTFNDQTLAYTVTPAVTYASTVSGLYAFGNFNSFQGPPTYAFTLKSNNTWELAEIRLKAGDYFKLFETSNLSGKNFGDAGYDGTAELFGSNIVMPGGTADAFYKIVFNDLTLAYSITLVRYPFPSNLYLVGGSTTAGWTPSNSIPFKKLSDGNFEIFAYITAGGGGYKLLEIQDWPGDWGANPANPGHVVQTGEDNMTVAEDGFYRVRVNFADFSYTATKMTFGIVGDATPNGWPPAPPAAQNDTPMTFVSGHTWAVDVTLTTGAFKFRANQDWSTNFGVDSGMTLRYDGDNMVSPGAGSYHIEMILDPVGGYRYTITPN